MIGWRLPSGRGALEQPNATGDGDVNLTPEFWALVVATGVATGLFGDLMMFILHSVSHVAFGYSHGGYTSGVTRAGPERRVVAIVVGGAIVGPGWYLTRRLTRGHPADLDDSLWTGHGELSARRGFFTAALSEVAVGSGASLGREAAPKLMGAVSASVLARWRSLTPAQQRLLVACGGGAGMAAVYNVPLGGSLVAAELLYGSLALPVILPALTCSFVATAVSWIYLPTHATYVHVPIYHVTATQLVWAAIAGPVIGLVAVAYVRLIGWVAHHRLSGGYAAAGPVLAFAVLGAVAVWYPQLFGNGKGMAHDAFLGRGGVSVLVALFALKPVVTSLCLGSGATGGLFTPTMSTGAMLGGALGIGWSAAWPGAAMGSYAVVGSAAMIGAATQAPLSSLALILELTHTTDTLIVPMLTATALATVVARYLDGYSIYSARLSA